MRAIQLIRSYGYTGEFLLYCIIIDFKESFHRINFWKGDHKCVPFAQPYRDPYKRNVIIPQWQKDLAHWANRKELFFKCEFADYEPRKGFKCKEYFE